MNQNSLRMNFYQFVGGILASYNDKEQAMAIIMEELTKVASTNEDIKEFDTSLIKPILKAAEYILSCRHDKLLEDSQKTFGDNIPAPIRKALEENKTLANNLKQYIDKL